MILDNCKRLLAHYESVGNVEAAQEMRTRLTQKYKVSLDSLKENSEVSNDGKKPKR